MSDIDRLNAHGSSHEPSPATKRLFLSVLHQPYFAGGTRLPGLFSVTGSDRSAKLFFTAVLLELVGFGTMRLFANASPVLLGLAVLFDIVLGYLAHLPVTRISLYSNQAVAARSHDEQELAAKRARACRIARAALVVPIYAFASFKAWLLAIAYGRIDMLSLALMACYFITALIHHHFTGQFFAERALQGALRKEYAAYLENPQVTALRFGGARSVEHAIAGVVPVRSVRHELTATHLITRGTLLDRDVQTLVGAQPDMLKEAVGRLCLREQLRILADEPVADGAAARSLEGVNNAQSASQPEARDGQTGNIAASVSRPLPPIAPPPRTAG